MSSFSQGNEKEEKDSKNVSFQSNGASIAHAIRKISEVPLGTAVWSDQASDNNIEDGMVAMITLVPKHVIEQDSSSSELLEVSTELFKESNQ